LARRLGGYVRDRHDGVAVSRGAPAPSPISVRRLSETLRPAADVIAAGVGNLPADIELQPISSAVRSVPAVLTPGGAPCAAKRSPPRGHEVPRHGGTLMVQNGL
jgi:hypothetical protein